MIIIIVMKLASSCRVETLLPFEAIRFVDVDTTPDNCVVLIVYF